VVGLAVGVLELAAICGETLQATADIDPQLAAPATPDAMASEVTARPELINNRLAHILVPFFPAGTTPLRTP
jgi:hypothetical protein